MGTKTTYQCDLCRSEVPHYSDLRLLKIRLIPLDGRGDCLSGQVRNVSAEWCLGCTKGLFEKEPHTELSLNQVNHSISKTIDKHTT
jgi:hypothetical protein